jgi:prepilin peptidase CpaA
MVLNYSPGTCGMLAELASLREFQALAVVAPILVYVIVEDLRSYRIRNEAVLALLVLFVVFFTTIGDFAALKSHLLFGLGLFALFLGMYWFRMLGGGDVKLLAVACFWLGLENALLFAVLLAALSLAYAEGAKRDLLPYKMQKGRLKVPYGPTIAVAWIMTLLITAVAQLTSSPIPSL